MWNALFSGEILLGLWNGWIPRALGEILMVSLSYSATYFINKYIISDKELQKYTGHVAEYFVSSFTYPFTVVSQCMVVSRYEINSYFGSKVLIFWNIV